MAWQHAKPIGGVRFAWSRQGKEMLYITIAGVKFIAFKVNNKFGSHDWDWLIYEDLKNEEKDRKPMKEDIPF